MQAFDERLAAFFAPPTRGDAYGHGGRGPYQPGRQPRRQGRAPLSGRESPRAVVSESWRNSRIVQPSRTQLPSDREAAILVTLINHPALCGGMLEPLAALQLPSPVARGLLTAILDLVTREHDIEATALGEALGARGFGESIERMGQVLARQGIWQSGAEVADADAETGLRHALALHYKSVELNKALKAAELALGNDPSEETFERLRDIQNQITTVDGTEALIEGFGSLSGRATRSF
jgi:DNA primase